MAKEFNNTLVTSKYRAYDPNGVYREVVVLTPTAKKRYEAKGWTFRRAFK